MDLKFFEKQKNIERNVDNFLKCLENVKLTNIINKSFVDHYIRFFDSKKVHDHRLHLKKFLIRAETYSRFFVEPRIYICDDCDISFSYNDENGVLYNFSYRVDTNQNIYENFEDLIFGRFRRIKFYVYDNTENENDSDQIIYIEN